MTLRATLALLAAGFLLSGCPGNLPRNDAAAPTMTDGDRPDAPPDASSDVPAADLGIQFTFVSAAIEGSGADGGVSIHAQMSWQAAIEGSSADGRLRIRGVMY